MSRTRYTRGKGGRFTGSTKGPTPPPPAPAPPPTSRPAWADPGRALPGYTPLSRDAADRHHNVAWHLGRNVRDRYPDADRVVIQTTSYGCRPVAVLAGASSRWLAGHDGAHDAEEFADYLRAEVLLFDVEQAGPYDDPSGAEDLRVVHLPAPLDVRGGVPVPPPPLDGAHDYRPRGSWWQRLRRPGSR